MALTPGIGKDKQTGQKVFMLQPQPEFVDVPKLLRILKAEFPEEFRTIWYEPILPSDKEFKPNIVLP